MDLDLSANSRATNFFSLSFCFFRAAIALVTSSCSSLDKSAWAPA